jgi:hypothetical protein
MHRGTEEELRVRAEVIVKVPNRKTSLQFFRVAHAALYNKGSFKHDAFQQSWLSRWAGNCRARTPAQPKGAFKFWECSVSAKDYTYMAPPICNLGLTGGMRTRSIYRLSEWTYSATLRGYLQHGGGRGIKAGEPPSSLDYGKAGGQAVGLVHNLS